MKEDRERRRALALSKKAEEDRKRDEEERKARRDRDELVAAQIAANKPKAIVRPKSKVSFHPRFRLGDQLTKIWDP